MSVIDEAREALVILKDTEHFLLEEMCSGKMTMGNHGEYVRKLRECQGLIKSQESAITEMDGVDGVIRGQDGPAVWDARRNQA